ncbi:hypothetical protein [Botrimarina hoheduenensis]|uniref:Uncharacterized protein n=1 Tax=Botrimarina hoheduenensis TaxID=2528000 RepID=A0A5C5WAZ0_9BACT|nr:hypothetical protein [Botrimarina hoheduenensis]TWT47335.1 hypothetical protein Pla111_09480 [Botrimarina hoheduenensis]
MANHRVFLPLLLILGLALTGFAWGQEAASDTPAAVDPVPSPSVSQKAAETLKSARETAETLAQTIDQDERVQQVSAGLLQPIYQLAEAFSFPAFHWIAFALMAAGVVSFALQLTLGKLVVLGRMGFSLSEIISDLLGLLVSLVGLVLTTQAAAQNSSFTNSSGAVLSSALVGVLVGLVLYVWGQRQELQAVEGRRRVASAASETE